MLHDCWIVFEFTKSSVATITQETSEGISFMAVIKAPCDGMFTTDWTWSWGRLGMELL